MTKLVNILKKPVAVVGLLSVALASGVASADFNPKFYVGAGVDYARYGLAKEIKKDLADEGVKVKNKGFGLLIPVLGVKFTENFGLEAGYSFNKKISFKEEGEPTLDYKVRNLYLDLMGYMPVMDQVDLIGGVGVGRVMVKAGNDAANKVLNDDKLKIKNSFGWRVKAGAQYNFNTNFGVRALISYQSANNKVKSSDSGKINDKFVKNMTSIGLAATYTF